MLVEMNKLEAPSMLLEDFNYIINKAIYQYINKRYNIYDVNQQTSDDLRVLKSTAILTPNTGSNSYGENDPIFGNIAEFNLPLDYMHLLNCMCNFKVEEDFKCYNKGDNVQFAARRMTSDMWSQVLNNFYLRPMYRRPYYFIHNVNTNIELPTNPSNGWTSGTDQMPDTLIGSKVISNVNGESLPVDDGQNAWLVVGVQYLLEVDGSGYCIIKDPTNELDILYVKIENAIITHASKTKPQTRATEVKISTELPRTITIGGKQSSLIEKPGMNRYGNASPVRMEVRYGKDSSVFKLDRIYIDYIKTPQHIRLTQEQLDTTRDTSQIMEFPDYVCQEIINELVKLMMENAGDPRLQTHIPINQTIANPAPQQQPSK